MGRTPTTGLWVVTVAVSLALHAALGFWLRSRSTRPPPPAVNRPIEWTLIEATPASPPPAPSPTPEPPLSPKRLATPARRPPPTAAPPAEVAAAPDSEPAATSPLEAPAPDDSDVPRADTPRAHGGPARPVLDPRLLSQPGLSTALEAPAESTFAVKNDAPGGLHAPEVHEDVVKHITQETLGKAKVTRGLVHPYYAQLGRKLLKTWDAERAVQRKGLRGYGEQMSERSKVWTNIWLERAAQFGGSGNPLDASDEDRPREIERAAPSVDPNLAARQKLKKQMRQEFRSTRKALLRVVQAPGGKLLRVELVSPSNDPAVDREALVDVRTAAAQLPPPPDEVRGGRKELVSLWQFELIVTIQPPVPSISFEFDEVLGYVDPKLPLDRRIYKRVRLVSVD